MKKIKICIFFISLFSITHNCYSQKSVIEEYPWIIGEWCVDTVCYYDDGAIVDHICGFLIATDKYCQGYSNRSEDPTSYFSLDDVRSFLKKSYAFLNEEQGYCQYITDDESCRIEIIGNSLGIRIGPDDDIIYLHKVADYKPAVEQPIFLSHKSYPDSCFVQVVPSDKKRFKWLYGIWYNPRSDKYIVLTPKHIHNGKKLGDIFHQKLLKLTVIKKHPTHSEYIILNDGDSLNLYADEVRQTLFSESNGEDAQEVQVYTWERQNTLTNVIFKLVMLIVCLVLGIVAVVFGIILLVKWLMSRKNKEEEKFVKGVSHHAENCNKQDVPVVAENRAKKVVSPSKRVDPESGSQKSVQKVYAHQAVPPVDDPQKPVSQVMETPVNKESATVAPNPEMKVRASELASRLLERAKGIKEQISQNQAEKDNMRNANLSAVMGTKTESSGQVIIYMSKPKALVALGYYVKVAVDGVEVAKLNSEERLVLPVSKESMIKISNTVGLFFKEYVCLPNEKKLIVVGYNRGFLVNEQVIERDGVKLVETNKQKKDSEQKNEEKNQSVLGSIGGAIKKNKRGLLLAATAVAAIAGIDDVLGNDISDGVDLDLDGDGLDDAVGFDTDGDGIIDSISADTDGDGIIDSSITDSDGDGMFDTMSVDNNGDGIMDSVAMDTDGDGKFDSFGMDTNGDGNFDTFGRDVDGDGAVDVMSRDIDGDGHADLMGMDTDGDHKIDSWAMDTNGDGRADTWGMDVNGDGSTDVIGRDLNGDGRTDVVFDK